MKYFTLVLALVALPVATSVTLKLVAGWNGYLGMEGLSPMFVLGFVWLTFFLLLGASLLGFSAKDN